MSKKISVVINTLNEEKNIEAAIKSVAWADEVMVCDMHSDDGTVALAKKLGAKIVFHERTGFVEPARNFAVSKASGEWALVLDADETIPDSLAKKLAEIATGDEYDFVEIPRKNIIFGRWMQATKWWPDYKLRFFRKGKVTWSDRIHLPPSALGKGLKLEAREDLSIVHHHYQSIYQFIERMNQYSSIQAQELRKQGYKFVWTDLLTSPVNEFLSRFFANRGFEDGLHGFSLSLLQAFSFLVVYLKVWEMEKFKGGEIKLSEVHQAAKKAGDEINYWFKYGNLSKNPLKRILQKVGNRLT